MSKYSFNIRVKIYSLLFIGLLVYVFVMFYLTVPPQFYQMLIGLPVLLIIPLYIFTYKITITDNFISQSFCWLFLIEIEWKDIQSVKPDQTIVGPSIKIVTYQTDEKVSREINVVLWNLQNKKHLINDILQNTNISQVDKDY